MDFTQIGSSSSSLEMSQELSEKNMGLASDRSLNKKNGAEESQTDLVLNPHADPKDLDSSNRGRHWCLTINNWYAQETEVFNKLFEQNHLVYFVYGKEGKNKTPHLQCYIYTSKTVSFTQVRNWWPRARVAPKYKKSTPQQASDYCKKEEDYVEKGDLPAPQYQKGGDKTKLNWDSVKQAAIDGRLDDIDSKVFVQHYTTIKQINFDYNPVPKPLTKLTNEWIYGKTGVGKSRLARLENPNYYDKACNKWWDNYKHQPVVLIDDFPKDGAYLSQHLLRWADHYPFPSEIKRHQTELRPEKIVVTSNYHPNEIFSGETLEAILRRFKLRHIVEMVKFDETEHKKKKKRQRSKSPPQNNGRPPLYRQNAQGDILLNERIQSMQQRLDDFIDLT